MSGEPGTKTLDGSAIRAFGDWALGADRADDLRPRLRILHHADLRRIGAGSLAGSALDAGVEQLVGRTEPLFAEPGEGGWERPLDDPRISRKQLRVRFARERGVFEVEPHPDGKRKLGVWTPGGGIHELRGLVELSPGAAIAIEDRALLGLELIRCSAGRADAPLDEAASHPRLVGESDAAWRLREEIADAARFSHPVLVLGETGSGKEVVAQAIHRQSDRRNGPLVVVNCAALPETLAESLLFGHSKGAFTGAATDREGFFRAAHGGTLFLDELGEMPIAVQPKLLRTLQDGRITPVGRHDAVHVDVRVVAATNRDPAEAMASGRLREDLYHRLAGHVIRVPTLSERRFDVPELFVAFLSAQSRSQPGLSWLFHGHAAGEPALPLSFVRRLLEHAWPGNVRELRHFAELCARKNVGATSFRAPFGSAIFSTEEAGRDSAVDLVPASTPESADVAFRDPDGGPHSTEHIATASRALALARKTVAKLFDDATLFAEIGAGADRLEARLEAAAGERLLTMLERHDFEQRALAAELEVSPATLIKLMQRFRIPRALDLDEATVKAALEATGADVEAAARRLRVSAQGLKKRLILLRLRQPEGSAR